MNNPSMLPVGTILRNQYRIDRQLASGGFGNTYMATNTQFNEVVAIKEFFMKDACQRNNDQTTVSITSADKEKQFDEQLAEFKKEARRIRQLHNEHIICVHNLFDENGTAYYVMDYIDGESLDTMLKRTGQPLSETEVRRIMQQVLIALKTVHEAGLWHLDLKPGNIMLDKTGNVKLIDFGASKQLDKVTGGATALTHQAASKGYAPLEQTEENYSKYGPWTDIYALGATLYALLTNKRPPLPSDIDDDESADKHEALPFPADVSTEMRQLILRMMNTNRSKRPQSIDDIQLEASAQPQSQPSSRSQPQSSQENADSEETIFASPSNTEANKDEETILSESPKTPTPPQPVSNYTYQESNGGISNLTAGFIVLIFFAVIFFIFFLGVGRGKKVQAPVQDIDSIAEVVDTIADSLEVDTFAADTIALEDEGYRYASESMTFESKLGMCYYTGEFDSDDTPHGKGEAKFLDGRYYTGEWYHGELTNRVDGFFRYNNGDTFKGQFDDNKFYYGVYTIAENGSHFNGYFRNGKPYNGKWYDRSGNVLQVVN